MNRLVCIATLSTILAGAAGVRAIRDAGCEAGCEAGPPLICHPFDIGKADSLPFGDSTFETAKGYKADAVVTDTLRILKSAPSVLVRMETIRRASIYARENRTLALELFARLAGAALDAECAAPRSLADTDTDPPGEGGRAKAALAWFDAGYLVASFDHIGIDLPEPCGAADGIFGYAWVRKAISFAPDEAPMQFAAALMTLPEMHKGVEASHAAHLRTAVAGAPRGSLLEKNLAVHLARWGESLEKIRAEVAAAGKDQDAKTPPPG